MSLRVKKKYILTVVLFIALQFVSLVSAEAYGKNEEDAQNAIDTAQNMLTSAFRSLIEAEKSGANVTFLSEKLTNAAGHLTSAFLFYKAQNFSLAESSALTCYALAQSVKVEADELMEYPAVFQRLNNFSFRIFGYVVSVSAIVLGSIFSWQFFKKQYFQKAEKMRPEVAS